MHLEKVEKPGVPGAVILAGGDSKRLGRPKAWLDFYGQPLVEVVVERLSSLFDEITVVTDKPGQYSHLGVRLTGDRLTGQLKSPLRGIHAGLLSSGRPGQFVVACDMPFINIDLVRYMALYAAEYDAVVPRIGEYYQPLHAFYSRSCAGLIEKQLQGGSYKIIDFYGALRIKHIGPAEIKRFDPDQLSFTNINTRADYERALKIFSKRFKTG